MSFRLLSLAERTLNRLRLSHKIALLGLLLSLPLVLLLFWQGIQFRRWSEDEARAGRRIEREAILAQILHQLAHRADYGLDPSPTVLHEQPVTLQALDERIHLNLVRLDASGWARDMRPMANYPEARQFLTALRGLPSLTVDVTPQEWREHHQRTLERLAGILPAVAVDWEAENEAQRAQILVEQFLTCAVPQLVVRLGAVTELVAARSANDSAVNHHELLVKLGRLRQSEADAVHVLERIKKSHPHVIGQVGTVVAARLEEFAHTLDRIEAWESADQSEMDLDTVWRNSVAARLATEQAAVACAANLAAQHDSAARAWQRMSLIAFGLTLVVGSLAWGLILWMQSAVQRSLETLHDISRISPTADEPPPPVALENVDDEFSDVVRSFQRTIALIQTNNNIAQEAARRACLAEMEARQHQEKFALLASATSEGHWDWDIRTDYTTFSPQIWKWLGYRPEHAPKPTFADFIDLIHEDDRKRVTGAIDAHIQHRRSFDCEFRLKNILNDYRWFHAKGQAKWDGNGFPVRMAGILNDVTDRRRLEADRDRYIADLQTSRDHIAAQAARLMEQTETLRHTQKLAEDASRSKSEFLANMSHELRTPLTAILGYSDLLYEEGDLSRAPRSRLEMIDSIRVNGQHLLLIIEDILDLSKIEAGKMLIEALPCQPAAILDESRRLLELRAQTKGLEFEIRAIGPLPSTFISDPKRIRQILLNLVGNAIKFTEQGRITLEMSATPGPRARLQFVVTDTGIGITPEQLGQLFQPFGQADASTTRRFGGTGLGLSISRRLAELLKGDITVESEPGRGSKFTVTILADVPEDAVWQRIDLSTSSVEVELPPVAPSNTILQGARILVVDDVEPNRRLIDFLLKKVGCIVETVTDGQEALDAIAAAETGQHPFDIVLMDMQMPNLNGYEATRRLRAMGYRGSIIAMTAAALSEDREDCLAAGCDDYLTKPIDRTSLIEVCSHFRYAVRIPPPSPR